jgi:hypothetical protein
VIHDWQVFDDCHQSCKRCGLRLWRARSGGSWKAVTGDGVPASFGLLPDGSPVECRPPRNLLPGVVVIDYTGDPDRHSGCERFMHRVRDEADPGPALANPGGAPTACGFPAVFWELGPPRLHLGWTWCLDCFPERAGDGARGRLEQAPHVGRYEREQLAAAERRELGHAKRKATLAAKAEAKAALMSATTIAGRCYCPKCAGGLPSQAETIRAIQGIQRRPQGWNPK